jgi:hypothetical protein
MFIREFGNYAEFWELQEQGYIDPQFVEADNPAHTAGPPFVPEYVLTFDIPGDGTYRIEAKCALDNVSDFPPRWRLTGGIWHLRGMYIDDRGVVRWLEDDRPIY